MRLFLLLRHSMLMVSRKLKNYALLSVTIIISFSLLLGYMVFTDSMIFTSSKDLFRIPRELIIVREKAGAKYLTEEQVQLVLDKTESTGERSYSFMTRLGGKTDIDWVLNDGSVHEMIIAWAAFTVPKNVTFATTDNSEWIDIEWLDNRNDETIALAVDEAVIDKSLYYLLGMDQMNEPWISIRLSLKNQWGTDIQRTIRVKVVGVHNCTYWLPQLDDRGDIITTLKDKNYINGYALLSSQIYDMQKMQGLLPSGNYLAIYTNNPKEVTDTIKKLDFQVDSIYKYQNEASETIRTEKQTKAIISCALLVLLGINLYSCFSNALADRRYEIGVKRALGASGWSIVRQFLYESLIVMVANTLISVSLVADLAAIYKYMVEHTPMEDGSYPEFILCISPYSVAMFGVCAITLTVVFSLIFAFQATRVEIIKHLKAE